MKTGHAHFNVSDKRICQIVGVIPPAHDGVGHAALKLHRIFSKNAITSIVITSADQSSGDAIFPIVKKWSIWRLLPVLKLLSQWKITHIIIHYPSHVYQRYAGLIILCCLAILSGYRCNILVHEYASYSLFGKLRILALALFCRHVMVSDNENFSLFKKKRFLRNKIVWFPTGSNFQYVAAQVEKNENSKKTSVLFFGLIRGGKGIDKILELNRDEKFQGHFQLSVAGGLTESPTEEEKQTLKAIKSASNIRYYGFLDDDALIGAFGFHDIFFLPFEGGLTERRGSFMAGMAFGKIVITTFPKHNIEGLEDFKNIIFLKSLNTEEISDKFMMVSKLTENERNSIGNNAKLWYDKLYSDELMLQRLSIIFV